MKPINTNTSSLRELLTLGALYADKTRYLYPLLNQAAGKLYFLSRPRRFGKSLTVSTFEEIFKGNKELFRGLAIDDLPYDWKSYPIIRIDLGDRPAATPELLSQSLIEALNENAKRLNCILSATHPASRFRELVLQASSDNPVVILIDEYDKPILGNIDNPQVGEILKILKSFYSVVKTAEEHIRFAFLTGVSKFSKVSVFSDLNNLTDLTMDSRYAALLGFTQEELETNFSEHIDQLAAREGVSRPQMLEKIRHWYNGYRFSEAETTVYNPVSTGKLFDTKKFANYWFETGTPTMLINLMKAKCFDIEDEKQRFIDAEAFSAYEIDHLEILPLLFQTGYLTISETQRFGGGTEYKLDYPNLEVKNSMTKVLLAHAAEKSASKTSGALKALRAAFFTNDLNEAFLTLRSLFAGISQDLHLPKERYYQSLFIMVFRLLGVDIRTEVKTADGRIDAVVESTNTVYVLEFKLNGTAQEALAQIKDKNYCLPYRNSGKKVIAVGIEFSWQTRNIAEWIMENVESQGF